VTIHGHRWAYVKAGRGPTLLLLHGLGGDHSTWLPVLPALSRRFTVIAPDLLGHGDSAKPRTDYSIAGYANGMRDLLAVLGVDQVTVVGHSLGGGVAMQLAYQYPGIVERLCLVAPGGMGAEVCLLLRMASLPGSGPVIDALTIPPVRLLGRAALAVLARTRLPPLRDSDELGEIYQHLGDPAARHAFRQLLRSVVDWHGQISTVTDRAYLALQIPVCVVWGEEDTVVSVRPASAASGYLPSGRVEVLRHAGHFPHRDHPARFVEIVRTFVAETPPAAYHHGHWNAVLRRGPAPRLTAVPAVDRTSPGQAPGPWWGLCRPG
jgi:pimeloyl-ACP methyl ester carboxylesterase